MIRGMAHRASDGKPMVFLGLTAENLQRLQQDEPITLNLRRLIPGGPPIEELPDVDVAIFAVGSRELRLLMEAAAR